MGKKNKFEVSIDKEKHLLYADLTVYTQPEWKGVVYYDTYEVIKELNRQGYNFTQTDCAKPHRHVLRSDNGYPEVQTGRWVFKLSSGTARAAEEKPVEKPVEKPATQKKPASKKKPTPKPTKKQTTKEILEAYGKEKD